MSRDSVIFHHYRAGAGDSRGCTAKLLSRVSWKRFAGRGEMDGAARSPANTPINHSDEASEKFLANEPPRWSEGNENDDFTLATLYPLVLFCPFFIFFIARFFYFLSLFPPLFFLSLFSFFFKIFRNLFDEPIARR